MKCPNCENTNDAEGYALFEIADDYQDGIVVCNYCGKTIATFNLVVVSN